MAHCMASSTFRMYHVEVGFSNTHQNFSNVVTKGCVLEMGLDDNLSSFKQWQMPITMHVTKRFLNLGLPIVWKTILWNANLKIIVH